MDNITTICIVIFSANIFAYLSLCQVKEKNQDLEKQLERRSGHLERLIKEKEKEKNELMKTLETKEAEYKQLQNMLERLKEEHEDRHTRLKGRQSETIYIFNVSYCFDTTYIKMSFFCLGFT